jgi:hypothetical protein
MSPHLLAIIITCSVVGVLLLSAIGMGVFLWYHRRHVTVAAPEQPPSGFNDEKRSSPHPGFEDIEIEAPQRPPPARQCSWCYIAENKLCKWCAGEAQDDEDHVQDAGRGRLHVDTTDLRHNGWRSVLSSPAPSRPPSRAPSRNPTPPGSRSRS